MKNSCKTILMAFLLLFPFATYAEKSDKKLSLTVEADVSTHIENAFDYYFGNGVEINKAESFKCFMKAAEQGHPAAMYQFAMMYMDGEGVQKGSEIAFKWITRSAK